METILEKARELGQLIASSEEYRNLNNEQSNASSNAELSDLFAEYNDIQDKLMELEMEDEPDENEVTGLMDEADRLQEQIAAHSSMEKVNEAQNNFNRLMERVNRALQVQLNGGSESDEEAEGCGSGGCAGCSGCGSAR